MGNLEYPSLVQDTTVQLPSLSEARLVKPSGTILATLMPRWNYAPLRNFSNEENYGQTADGKLGIECTVQAGVEDILMTEGWYYREVAPSHIKDQKPQPHDAYFTTVVARHEHFNHLLVQPIVVMLGQGPDPEPFDLLGSLF